MTSACLTYANEIEFAHPGTMIGERRPCSVSGKGEIPRELHAGLCVTGFALVWLLAGCAAGGHHAAAPPADPGRIQFGAYCAACHLSNAPGISAEAPPLDGSAWVMGSEDRLIKIVLQGLRGAIKVGGKTYNLEMPALGQAMTDAQIASLLSYVRREFGRGGEPILPAAVTRVRAATRNRSGYWTADELLKEP